MTATTTASVTSRSDRAQHQSRQWCDGGSDCADGFHQHRIAEPWQQYPGGPSLTAAIEDHDDDDPGVPSVAISFSRDGQIADGCVTMSLSRGKELAYSLLQAIARAENAGA